TWYDGSDIENILEEYPQFKKWFDEHHTIDEIDCFTVCDVEEWFEDFTETWINPKLAQHSELPYTLLYQSIDIELLAQNCSEVEDGGATFSFDKETGLCLCLAY
ncbi:hypothetical protein ACFQY8_03095, partial [Alloscardovia venturai]